MPYGVDRQAVGKILAQAGWQCRPVQPTTPCPGRGAMWIVHATEEPSSGLRMGKLSFPDRSKMSMDLPPVRSL